MIHPHLGQVREPRNECARCCADLTRTIGTAQPAPAMMCWPCTRIEVDEERERYADAGPADVGGSLDSAREDLLKLQRSRVRQALGGAFDPYNP
jgi:hypothetical protein